MSLFTSQMGFLTLKPTVSEKWNSVTIKTGFLTRLFTLFLYVQTVEILPSEKIIKFNYRRAYLFKSQKIVSFKNVSYIDYTFGSLITDFGLTSSGIGRHDQVESFRISIVTKNKERFPICAYRGEGSKCTGLFGVLLGGDDLIDFSGTQEGESRKLAEYIAKLIDVKIGKPAGFSIEMAKCPKCGRPTSQYKKNCLYCGAIIADPLNNLHN
jgi:hypothetical protein